MHASYPLTYCATLLAVTGAAIIAPPLVSPPTRDTAQKNYDVRLASGESDLITDTQAGLSGLSDHFDLAPFVALQQVAANQVGFAETALTDPSSVTNIPNEIGTNLTAGVTAPFEDFIPLPGSSPDVYSSLSTTPGTADFTGTVLGLNIGNYTTPLPSHAELFSLLNSDPALLNDLFPGTNLGTAASDLLGLSASPASGVLWGNGEHSCQPAAGSQQRPHAVGVRAWRLNT